MKSFFKIVLAFISMSVLSNTTQANITYVAKWGSYGSGDGQFNYPAGVAVDSSGNLYVADTHYNRIQKFNSSGQFVTKWGSTGSMDGQFSSPFGIAVDSSGNLYVADYGNNRIQKFNGSGQFVTKWGSYGSGDGQFNNPVGITADSSGNLYVTDYNNNRIQKFTNTGQFVTKWGSVGSGDGQFSYPRGVAVDSGGNLYVADHSNHRIQKFTSTGQFVTKLGSTSGSGNGQFSYPMGIAVDSASNLYVADYNNNRIQKLATVFSCSNVTEIPVAECQSLLELYNSTDGANWKNKTGWNQTNTPCSWYGVTCTSGRITKIDLTGNGLKNSLPNLNLSELTWLGLDNNQLNGSVPNFNLPKLIALGLGGTNQFSGTIPNFNLPNLQYLALDKNQLSGSVPNFNLPKLIALQLNGNKLSGSIPNFSSLSSLTQLWLQSNQLSGTIPNFTSFNLANLHAAFNNNCGLVAYDAAQESVLNQKDSSWKTLNPNCPVSSYNLTLNKTGNGQISGGGSFSANSTVNLIATPDAGWTFTGWLPSPCSNSFVMPNNALTCTANFTQNPFAVTLNKTGNGTITGNGNYAVGSTVNLIATPDANYTFTGWSPSPCATSFAMPNNALTCTANFTQNTFAVTLNKTGNGTITGNGNYAVGATVNLIATPDANYTFTGWSPSPCATSFAMPTNALTCTANFVQNTFCPNAICNVVKTGSDTTGDGSEAKPFATIQHGIDVAKTDYTVLVHPGTYIENLKFGNKNIIVKSKEGATKTIIDGNKQESVVTFIHDGDITLGAAATLQGFTITNGIGTLGNDDTYRVEFYAGSRLGGGVLCHKTKPILTDLIITQNFAQRGGGIFGRGCEPTVVNTVINKNTAVTDGGGVGFVSGWLKRPAFKNVLIVENTAAGNGGGIFADYSTQATMINSTISKNTSGYGRGGAIDRANASGVNLTNSIVWDNGTNPIYWRGGTSYTSQISYSIVQSGQSTNLISWGTGNLDADPLFIGSGNYHLSSNSPALGKGTLSGAPTNDLEGLSRPAPVGSNPDMGAYEMGGFSTVALTVTKTGNGSGTITGDGSFAANSTVILTATPDANSTFTGWSPTPCNFSFIMPANALTCTATFALKQFDLTVSKIGNGTVNGGGTYAVGSTVTLTATPDAGYKFIGWNPLTCKDSFAMPANALTCTATFEKLPPEQFTLTVNKVGNGTVNGGGTYAVGATVNLTATPDAGYKFIGWNPSTCKDSFAMPASALTCTATFEKLPPEQFTLTVNKVGNGTVNSGGTYAVGSTVTLTATPDANSTFTGWSPSPCNDSFVMPAQNLTCTANFTQVVSQCTTYDLFAHPQVYVPCVNVGGIVYKAGMNLIETSPTMRFEVDMSSLQLSNLIPNEQCAVFPAPNTLDHLRINCLDVGDKYWVDFKLIPVPNVIQFDLVDFGLN
jgi:DNA-binding beta-propeller fold protein YncE